jgi:hypothetical protein
MATKTKSRNRYYQPNPNKKLQADCVVRAMCKAMNKSWDEVYVELCTLGFRIKAMPNDKDTWKQYLDDNNFKYHKITVKRGSKRGTVAEFAEKHKKGTYVLQVANHIVTVVDGYYYDTWDCGSSSLYGYWEKV